MVKNGSPRRPFGSPRDDDAVFATSPVIAWPSINSVVARPKAVAIHPLTPETITFIDQQFRAQKSRNLLLDTPQGKVMVKGQRKPRDPVRFWLLSATGKFFSSPLDQTCAGLWRRTLTRAIELAPQINKLNT